MGLENRNELNVSLRATKRTLNLVASLSSEVGEKFDRIGIYDELGDLPPFLHLYEAVKHLPEKSDTQVGPVGIAASKHASMLDTIGYISLLHYIRPNKVFLGLVSGAGMDSIGLKPTPVQKLREAVETSLYLIKKREGGYEGKFYSIEPGFKLPYDTPGELPIFLGVWGDKMAGLAGEVADAVGVGSCANPEMVPVIREKLSAGIARAGRRPDDVKIILGAVTVIDSDRKRALEVARRHSVRLIANIAENDPTVMRDFQGEVKALINFLREGNVDHAAQCLPEEMLKRFVFAGTPADIIEQGERVFAAGASGIEFGTPHHSENQLEGIKLLVREVFPHFRSRG